MPPKAGLTRESIADVAVRQADALGLDRLTLSSLARCLKVEPPSLYSHYSGMPEIRQALRLRGFQMLGDLGRRAAVGRSAGDAVGAVASEVRSFVRLHPGLYQATVRTFAGDTPEIQKAAGGVLEVYLACLSGYGLKGDDAVHALRYLRSLLHGWTSLESSGGFGLRQDVDTSFDYLVAAAKATLSRWPRF